jgi:hypothetical protein
MHALVMMGMLGMLAAPAAEPQTKLVDNMEAPALYTPAQPELNLKWTGSVALETADFKEGKGCLRFRVISSRSGAESYPQWGRGLDRAQNDWTRYRALRYWVKVTSEDPTVPYKMMCIVVYNRDAPLQQFVRHIVPVGRWVQLTDSILTYNRDQVRGIIIYLYETHAAWQDNYTWLVDDLELVPMGGDDTAFDGLAVQSHRQPLAAPVRRVSAADGMALGLDGRGRVAEVRSGGALLSPASVRSMSGLMVRDWRQSEQPVPVEGEVAQEGQAVRQEATVAGGLRVRARYWPEGDRIRCRVKVADTGSADRPLTLYFAMPVEAVGWQWWDDIRTPRAIGGPGEFLYNQSTLQDPQVSPYPFCCISGQGKALSVAAPMEPPRLGRMVYNPQMRLLYVAYNFCLTPAAVKQKQAAEFEFFLFRPDPAWGMRSTVDRYYKYFPGAFVKRVPKEGGWECWGTNEAGKNVADMGLVYHWGPDTRGGAKTMADAVRYDNEHGYLSLPYIEWTNLHVSMEGYETAGNAEIMDRIRENADPARTLPRRGYVFPYDERLGPDYQGWMHRVYQAYLKSLMYTREGLLYGGADKSEFSLLVAKYLPFNPDPDIPGGAGEFFLTQYWPVIEKYYADNGAKPDGFGWDNFYASGGCLDFRREHLAYTDDPPLFDTMSLAPAIVKDVATYKLERRVAEKLRAEGRYLIANQGAISAVPATMAWLDIFGYEWNIRNAETYARTMGHHKPVCSLPCAPEHYRDPYVRDHLLYGCWPGGYYEVTDPTYLDLMRKYVPILRRMNAAGWEPITHARADDPQVQVERFGGPGGDILLSVRNGGPESKQVAVTVDETILPHTGLKRGATELVTGEQIGIAEGPPLKFLVEAPAGAVIVVALQP